MRENEPHGLTSHGITNPPPNPFFLCFTLSHYRPALAVDGLVLATVLLPQRRGRDPGARQRDPPPLRGL